MNKQEMLKEDFYKFVFQAGIKEIQDIKDIPVVPGSFEEVLNNIHRAKDKVAEKEFLSLYEKYGFDKNSKNNDPHGYNEFLNDLRGLDIVSEEVLNSIFCGEFPTGEFNASARRVPNGYLCLLNRGLRHFLYRISCAASYGCTDYNDLRTALIDKTNPNWLGMKIYALGTCANYLLNNEANFYWEGREQSTDCLMLGSAFSSSMRTFVVAHELAHAQLGHLNENKTNYLLTPVGELEVIQKSYDQEFEADAVAQAILIEMARKENHVGVICGGVCFLYADIIFDQFRNKLAGEFNSISTTHPPSEQRIDSLLNLISTYCSEYESEFVDMALKVFQQLEQVVKFSNVRLENGGIEIEFEE